MSAPPEPKVYHITHVDNLPAILRDGGLLSDARVTARGGPDRAIGMAAIKRRRFELDVPCHPGTKVADYVPFYFCPRSVMLYVIHRGNHPDLSFRGGQDLILHLEADLHRVVRWAEAYGVRWAFSLSNAGASHTEFRHGIEHLDELDWDAIFATDFRPPDVKEGKQAEFLVRDFVPFDLVERIGVRQETIRTRVSRELASSGYRTGVDVLASWYY